MDTFKLRANIDTIMEETINSIFDNPPFEISEGWKALKDKIIHMCFSIGDPLGAKRTLLSITNRKIKYWTKRDRMYKKCSKHEYSRILKTETKPEPFNYSLKAYLKRREKEIERETEINKRKKENGEPLIKLIYKGNTREEAINIFFLMRRKSALKGHFKWNFNNSHILTRQETDYIKLRLTTLNIFYNK